MALNKNSKSTQAAMQITSSNRARKPKISTDATTAGTRAISTFCMIEAVVALSLI